MYTFMHIGLKADLSMCFSFPLIPMIGAVHVNVAGDGGYGNEYAVGYYLNVCDW